MPPSLRTRTAGLVAVLAMLVVLVAAGCGSSGSGSGSGTSAGPTTTAAACASAGTRHFQKTRMVADLALAYGTFHRYLYKPYRAGTFKKGADGRISAILKGGIAAAAIVKLLKNAQGNAAADPRLCRYVPSMSTIISTLSGLGSSLRSGNGLAGLATAGGLFGSLKSAIGFGSRTGGIAGL